MHLTLGPVVQIATLGTLVTGLVSLVVWARIYRRQVNAQILIEITARYATIFHSFPAQLWLAQLDPDQPLPERRAEFTVRAFQYSTIVVFAYLLHERRFSPRTYGRFCKPNTDKQLPVPGSCESGT